MAESQLPTTDDLRAAVELAVRAPSMHNTQPWRWVLRPDGLDLHADPGRQLAVADPDRHALLIGCGAALELARLGLAERGWSATAHRLPDPADADLLARIMVTGSAEVSESILSRAAAARRRHSDRAPFAEKAVSEDVLDALRASVESDESDESDEVRLHVVARSDERLDLAVLVSRADDAMRNDPAYLAELARWTRAAGADDGVPAAAIPHVIGDEPRHANVPLRDFETGITGELRVHGGQDEHPALAIVMTSDAGAIGSLRAGEALARLLVEVERRGLAASIVSQPVDWPVLRERMRGLMSWDDHPQMIVRIGWATDDQTSGPTPRRSIDDVIEPPQQ